MPRHTISSSRHQSEIPAYELQRLTQANDGAMDQLQNHRHTIAEGLSPTGATLPNTPLPQSDGESPTSENQSLRSSLSEFDLDRLSLTTLSRFPTPSSCGSQDSDMQYDGLRTPGMDALGFIDPWIDSAGPSTTQASPASRRNLAYLDANSEVDPLTRPLQRRASWSEVSTMTKPIPNETLISRRNTLTQPRYIERDWAYPYNRRLSETVAAPRNSLALTRSRATVAHSFADTARETPRTTREKIASQFDPRFMLSLIDFREVVSPMTPKRAAYLSGFAACIAGAVVLEHFYHYGQHIVDAVQWNNLILMGFIYGIEPAMIVFVMAITTLPVKRERPRLSDDIEHQHSGSNTETTALIIPCHNSDPDSITRVISAARQHFAPEQIYIIDNGKEAVPPSDMKHFVHAIDPAIQYIWSPMGNKNIAQYVGALAAKQYEHVMLIDDDVVLPENYAAPVDKLNHLTKGVSFPIQGVDAQGKKPLFVGWQDLEYKMSGLCKLAEANTCGTMFPHGAAAFWDRETIIDVLKVHDLIFYGEDVKTGLGAMKIGKRMTIDMSITLNTEAPTTLFGTPPNYYQQRVRSWEMGRHLFNGKFAASLFRLNGQNTVAGFSMQKISQTYALASNLVDWLRLPLYAIMGGNQTFWQRSAGFYFLPIAPLLYYKYVKCHRRPDLAPNLAPIMTFPAYKVLFSLLSIFGAMRSLIMYRPGFKKQPDLAALEANQDPRAIWLDPRFAQNPGFLADHVPTVIQETEAEATSQAA